MNKTIKFYLHNNNDASEIRCNLREDEVPPEIIDPLTSGLYDYFYEVGFDVEYNDQGKIMNVKMIPKR
jgi:hypothetical protein